MEEMCLKISLEGVQRSRRADSQWQIVPYARCSNPECSLANGAESCTWHDQLVRGWRSQTLSGVAVSRPVQISCQIRRRCVVAAAEDEYGQSEFNMLRALSQCRSWSSGVTGSYFRLPYINLATALSTDWSRSSMYRVGQNNVSQRSLHNFVKYCPIFKIPSLSHSPENLQ